MDRPYRIAPMKGRDPLHDTARAVFLALVIFAGEFALGTAGALLYLFTHSG